MLASLTITGRVGALYQVLYTTNLQAPASWQVLTNVTLPASPFVVVDWDSANSPKRFYQAVYNPDPARLAYVQTGTFLMGSPATEPDREADEGPPMQVTFTRSFFVGKTEVTQADYLAVMSNNPSFFLGNLQRPVEQVTWAEANQYCALLTERERQAGRIDHQWVYRLPTEAEWEYACRAGATTRYSFGDDLTEIRLGNYGWFEANAGNATQPVAVKIPNPWGLFDMHGNVWEWCADWYASAYPGGSRVNPTGPASGVNKVLRGGAYNSSRLLCRSANRHYALPAERLPNIGFRVVLAPASP
jgi:formylglycine-generating enzyme required for sulfatase activity